MRIKQEEEKPKIIINKFDILQKMQASECTIKQLSNMLSLSVSQINKIKRMRDEEIMNGRSKSITKINEKQTVILRRTINDFIENAD